MLKKESILIIGGAGYIGSHMVRVLLEEGYNPIIFDNFSTGHQKSIPKGVRCVKGDLRDRKDIRKTFKKHPIDTVMHFAAYSIVSESVLKPLDYYENNTLACLHLIQEMLEYDITQFIFSSTAAVYGEPSLIPIDENHPTSPTNPYGHSKLMIEHLLKETARAFSFSYISLRYFNASGAHPSGETGEKHKPETHLIPNVLKAALGKRENLTIFGEDYATPDGTCIRDYIHVMDLCQAHLLALKALERKRIKNAIFNLGSGKGYSVREVIQTAEKITGRKIRTKAAPPRPGDPARLVASCKKITETLGWSPQRNLEQIIESSLRWAKKIDGENSS